METIIKITVLSLLIAAMTECSSHCCDDGGSQYFLYKTRNDYSNNLMVTWDTLPPEGKLTIKGVYYNPKKYANGYESRGCCAYSPSNSNSAFLSITIEEWAATHETIPAYTIEDSLKNYIIDMDPFVEFYELKRNVELGYGIEGLDIINDWIINGELTKYFNRIK